MYSSIVWCFFIFALGGCVGSFLNVVIYRLPRDLSLIYPGSACPKCSKSIGWYDNIPMVSWVVLGGKCRNCGARISGRYFVVELLTGCMFLGVFIFYFGRELGFLERSPIAGMPGLMEGGWLIFLLHIVLLSGLVAASAIDLELWVIPLWLCWFITGVGVAGCAIVPYLVSPVQISDFLLVPYVKNATVGLTGTALAAGGGIGMVISLVLLFTGVIKQSYVLENDEDMELEAGLEGDKPAGTGEPDPEDPNFDHRAEVFKEILFLGPIVICAVLFVICVRRFDQFGQIWVKFTDLPFAGGFLGGLFGYFVGAGIVWLTRILGTLGFGKEAMGLGDVHLMGAAGAFLGPGYVTAAFFAAPFFGLFWALSQMFFKKTRQIPYGPFLSLAVFAVIIAHNPIREYIQSIFYK